VSRETPSAPRGEQLYWSTIAKVLGWFAVILTILSLPRALGGRVADVVSALIFGSAAILLLWAARRIRADQPNSKQSTQGSIVGLLVVLVTACFFVTVVTYRWLMHELPSSAFVLLMVFGMSVVGSVAGFAVSTPANILFRRSPPKLRIPLSGIVWLLVCAAATKWLFNVGADANRTLIVSAIAAVSGLLVGTLNAEMIVRRWYLQRNSTSS
jgi:hypothetical protein